MTETISPNDPNPTVYWVFDVGGETRRKAEVLEGKMVDRKLEITDDDTFASYSEILAQAKKMIKEIDAQRMARNKPAQDALKAVNAQAKVIVTRLDKVVVAFSKPVTGYLQLKAKEEAEAQRKAAAAIKAQEELEASAPLSELPATPPPPVEAVKKYVAPVGALGSKSTLKKTWTYRITAPSKLPARFVEVKKGEIRKAISVMSDEVKKAGGNIPGVEVYQETSVSSRST